MISIKDWNNLTDSQRKKAVEFIMNQEGGVFSDIMPKLQGKDIAVQSKLNVYQKVMLSAISKNNKGEFTVKLETKL
jgi:hypothetical protein